MKKYMMFAALAAVAIVPALAEENNNTPEYLTVTNKEGQRILTGAVEYGTQSVTFEGDYVAIKLKGMDMATKISKDEIGKMTVTAYPVADLFDVVWDQSGNAKDLGRFALPVTKEGQTSNITINAENPYGITCPTFTNGYGAKPATADEVETLVGYYKASYSGVNADFYQAVNDGHTAELIFRLDSDATNSDNDADPATKDVEAKPFSCTQSGGFGFVIRKGTSQRTMNYMTANPTGSAQAYAYASTNCRPLKGDYYHLIAVQDKDSGTFKIYLDGELAGTTEDFINGDMKAVTAAYRWIGIGADPGNVKIDGTTTYVPESGFPGQVVVARMYDTPLSEEEVMLLFQRAESMKK